MGPGAINRKWVVASRPEAEITAGNFELQEAPVPELPDGAMLLKTRYLTVSPPARMALVSGGIARRPIPVVTISASNSSEWPTNPLRAGQSAIIVRA